jgi:CarboxypepD_reg-like domain
MKRSPASFLFALLPFLLPAQTPTQIIRGQAIDKDTREPLMGATVTVLNTAPAIGAICDADGNFVLKDVPVGRQQLQCAYVGYETWLSDPLVVNSTREIVLTVELLAAGVRGAEVTVTAKKFGNEALNEAAVLSTRSFSVDETQRHAASANDPGRMAMSFPGVQPSRDSRSDIIVRGNSALGVLWRLEGIDIANPNHFARRGTSGGGITIFSVSMLANSDFSTGAFPAEYGNAYSGVFDIRFRKGNAEKRQHTFRAGLLGLDYSTEGPFKKGGRATYLLNYRYSTLGILNKMGLHLVGERVDNTFQDVSFNLAFPSKNLRNTLTIWGIGGLSRENESAVENQAEWTQFDDYTQYEFNTNMGALGATFTTQIGDDAYLKTSLAATGQKIFVRDDTLNRERVAAFTNREDYRESRVVLSSFLNKKLSDRATLKTGFFLNHIPYNLRWENLGDGLLIDASGSTQLIQPYAQLRLRAAERLTMNLGIHAMFLTLNNKNSVEPRVNARYQIDEQNALSLAWGLHSRMLPIGNYFTRIGGRETNRDANFIRGQHLAAGYDLLPGNSLRLHAEIYYQKYRDVPVGAAPGSSWSILNTVQGFTQIAMVNEGKGENVGLDLSFEQSFRKGAFFLISGSIMKADYTDAQGRTFPTVFSSGASGTFMAGKEFSFKNASTLQLGLKLLFNGGQRLTPLLANQTVSRYSQNPLLDESRAFSEKVDSYFRPDLRIAYRKNNARAAWWVALDIQNVANRRNIDALSRNYDPDVNGWVYREQSGLTPILSFQIDF